MSAESFDQLDQLLRGVQAAGVVAFIVGLAMLARFAR